MSKVLGPLFAVWVRTMVVVENAAELVRTRRRRKQVLRILYIYKRVFLEQPRTRVVGGSAYYRLYQDMPDAELVRAIRVDSTLFRWFVSVMESDLLPKGKGRYLPIEPAEKVCIFLHRLASGMRLVDMCAMYDKSDKALRDCLNAVRVSFLRHFGRFIRVPCTRKEIKDAAESMYSKSNDKLANCIGAMDGSHIAIKCPSTELGMAYFHHKCGMCINIHIVCDGRYILDCDWFGVDGRGCCIVM